MTEPVLPDAPPLIREGGIDDAHAIRAVFLAATADEPHLRESDPDTGLPGWLEGFLGCGYLHELWIAELHGRVVGFATLIVDWLCHLYVTPYARNRGSGTKREGSFEGRLPLPGRNTSPGAEVFPV